MSAQPLTAEEVAELVRLKEKQQAHLHSIQDAVRVAVIGNMSVNDYEVDAIVEGLITHAEEFAAALQPFVELRK